MRKEVPYSPESEAVERGREGTRVAGWNGLSEEQESQRR